MYIGVLVSLRAKKVGVKTFISIKKGSPKENAIKLKDDWYTSPTPNSPLKKIVLIRSTEQKASPINDGIPINKTNW